ncbi:hypothetical protein [Actinomadura sp. WMMA1423]|uniref:hypothetical protein n=1 Tax=Actinomadura sp. WMMA1423 TaxID=2591108 RepID=UPI00114771EB|nr:hypothetical protein [Actinomadura sp. WMMA1423]
MGRTAQVDAQHLTERAQQRNAKAVGGNDLVGQHTLAGAGATYGIDDAVSAAAEAWVRKFANRHDCPAPALLREAVERGWHNKAARIREDPAAFCYHPRHAEDAAFAAEALEWLGLRPTVYLWVSTDEIASRPRAARYGRCPECRLRRNLRRDGTIGSHAGRDGEACPGKGAKPAAQEGTS